jgi:hypothetical protein
MVGGDPAQREPYGYVHSNVNKSIITLRNPFVRPRTMKLKIDEENGFRKFAGAQIVDVQYPTHTRMALAVKFGDTLTFDLDGYEQLVAEVHLGGSPEAAPPPPAGPEMSVALTRMRQEGSDLKVFTAVDVPDLYRPVRVAVLFEPDQEVRDIKADATDGGKPLTLSTENGGRGNWYWYWADLAPGKHTIAFTIHSRVPSHISAWMLTRRKLGIQPTGLLPAQDVERSTHLLLEETIR